MRAIKLKEEKIDELKKEGWKYDIMEGGYICPDFSCIAITDRFPYNNKLLRFSNDKNFNNTVEWLKNNGFLEE